MMQEIKEYTFRNGDYSFSILNRGAHISSLCVPDRNGKIENVVLTYPDWKTNPEKLLDVKACMNFVVGRFANRISGASFTLNGKTYSFTPNKGTVLCHCGEHNFARKFWDVRKVDNGFICHLKITEAEDGFPGDMDTWVKYTLTSGGNFTIHYKVLCTEDCPVNLTNHTYFNLSGDFSKTILREKAVFDSHALAELDEFSVPTGKMLDTDGTPFDFSTEKEVGRDILAAGGYDHPYAVFRSDSSSRGYTHFARITDPDSGRVMDCYTDLPSFQFYTANKLSSAGMGYADYQGLCLETQFFPDSPNKENFPSCTVRAGKIFESSTTYSFSTDKGVK